MEKTIKTPRVTQAMRYEDIIALLSGETPAHGTTSKVAVEFINERIAALAKKNANKSSKMTPAQEANESYKAQILDFLSTLPDDSMGVTCTDIKKGISDFVELDFQNQKVSALMRQLVARGDVVKNEGKGGKALFHLA